MRGTVFGDSLSASAPESADAIRAHSDNSVFDRQRLITAEHHLRDPFAVLHDDGVREYSYGPAEGLRGRICASIPTGSLALKPSGMSAVTPLASENDGSSPR